MSNELHNELPRLSAADSSKLLKRALRAAFKGIKFSVRLSTGTGYGNVHVSWTEGPTGDEVRAISEPFRGEGFDGMTDSTTYRDAIVEIDGQPHRSGLGLVLLHRNGYVA